MAYRVVLGAAAQKDLRRITQRSTFDRLTRALENLRLEPRPPDCRKLKGFDHWRIRVGDYRIIYSINDSESRVDVIRIRHRSIAYDR